MENEKDDTSNNDKEDLADVFKKVAQYKNKTVAKDLVQLKHVETKKQEVSQETKELAEALKQQEEEEKLS
ncbi:unnamed protein product, partial [marine sediment metagenome]